MRKARETMTPPPRESKLRRGAKGTKVSHALGQGPTQGPGTREGTHPERGEQTDGAGPAVLDQGTGDDLQGLGDSPVRPLLHTGHGLGLLRQGVGHGHLTGPAPWHQLGVQQHVAAHLHGVLEVALHFLEKANRTKPKLMTQEQVRGTKGLPDCQVQ